MLLGQGDEIGQVVALALAVDEPGADHDSPNAGGLEHALSVSTRGAMAPPKASMNGGGSSASGGAKTEAGRGTGWSSSKIVGLASPLVKTPKIAEPLVKISGFPEVAEGLGHHRHGVTVLGEAVRGALDLSDAGGADDGVHLGGGRRRLAGTAKSPATGVKPAALSFAAAASDRDKARTSCRCCDSFRATAAPINPVAPVTRIFIVPPSANQNRRFAWRHWSGGIAARPAGNANFDPGGDCGADVSRGPFNFWKMGALHVPQLPPAASPEAKPHPRRRPPHFRAIHALVWHTVNLRSAHLAPIIRTSEHFHVFSPPHT